MCGHTPTPASANPPAPSFTNGLIRSVIAPGRFVIIPGIHVNLAVSLAQGKNNQAVLKTQASGVLRSPEQAALRLADCFYSEAEEEEEEEEGGGGESCPQSPTRERIHLVHLNFPFLQRSLLSPPPGLRLSSTAMRSQAAKAQTVGAVPYSAPASRSRLELQIVTQKLFTPTGRK